jgi:PleD family two-component response regulator
MLGRFKDPHEKARKMATQEQTRKKVLLIDNDRFSLSVLQRLVDDLGYEPLIGTTAEAASTLLETQSVEVIVFNQDLEAEWGLSLVDQLPSAGATDSVPLILLSQASVRFSPRMKKLTTTWSVSRSRSLSNPSSYIFEAL